MSAQPNTRNETWRPDQDSPNPLRGRVVDVDHASNKHGEYPLVEILDADGCTWAFHAFRTIAKSELQKAKPEIGDEISVEWLGQPAGKEYHRYRVRHTDGRSRGVDWSSFDDAPPASDLEARIRAEVAAVEAERQADEDHDGASVATVESPGDEQLADDGTEGAVQPSGDDDIPF